MIKDQVEAANVRSANAHRRAEQVAKMNIHLERIVMEDHLKMKEISRVVDLVNRVNEGWRSMVINVTGL